MGEKIRGENQGQSTSDPLCCIESHWIGNQGYHYRRKNREHKSFYESRHRDLCHKWSPIAKAIFRPLVCDSAKATLFEYSLDILYTYW